MSVILIYLAIVNHHAYGITLSIIVQEFYVDNLASVAGITAVGGLGLSHSYDVWITYRSISIDYIYTRI